MNLRNYFTLLFAVHGCILSYANSRFRIITGSVSDIECSPYIVAIYYEEKHECAGSLVSLEKVITSANCLKDKNAKSIVVEAGVTNRALETGQSRKGKKKLIAPGYKATTHNMDIAAIKVSEPFIQDLKVNPIPICSSELTADTAMHVSGWGSTNVHSTYHEAVLRTTIVHISPLRFCANAYVTRGITLTESMLCAGLSGCDAFDGDSGAPGVVEGELCAVVSFWERPENPLFPVVYTNITNEKVLKFIKKVMKVNW